MKRLYQLLILVVFTGCKFDTESLDHDKGNDLVNATLWYQTSDEMEVQYRQAYSRAGELLKKYFADKGEGIPSAVILDVDETVLDNSPYEARLIQNGEFYSSESWAKWVKEASAMPLPGALEFTRMADSLGVDVFFITNRVAALKEPTLKNLVERGFPVKDEKHLMLKDSTSNKTFRREQVKEYYKVLLLVGDQFSDFAEDVALDADTVRDHFIMLPNPMYGRFLDQVYQGDFSLPEQKKAALRQAALKTSAE